MKMYLYVVRDTVAGESSPVYESKNDAVARRAFEKLFAQDDVHKSEFLLMKIGEIDHETDVITPMTPVEVNLVEVEHE